MRIPSGVTDQYIYFVAVDATDFATRETGLATFTVYRSRNGAAAAAMTTPTINETDATNMPGVYELLLDEDMSIDAGNDSEEIAYHITHAGMSPVTRTIELYRRTVSDGFTIATNSGGTITGAVTVGAMSNSSITNASISNNAITAAKVDTDVHAECADAVWDELMAGHVTADSAGLVLNDWQDAGRLDTILDAVKADTTTTIAGISGLTSATAVNNALIDSIVLAVITNAAGADIAADIIALDAVADAIKLETDKMTFTVTNRLDVNTREINGATVVGDGNATPWDGA